MIARGETIDHDGAVELLGEDGFVAAAEVAAPLDFAAVLLEDFHGVVVADARERGLHCFELCDVAFQDFQLFAAVFQDAADDVDDHLFGDALYFFEIGVGHFGLDHPELGEVAAGLGFLGAEGGAEAVDLAEGHGVGFVVELAGLREVGFLVVEVVDFEKRRGAFAGGRREDGRIDEREAVRYRSSRERL